MAEALTRIHSNDVDQPVLVGIEAAGYLLVFTYSNGSTHTEDLELYLDQLVLDIENTVASNVLTLVGKCSIFNPAIGLEKNGDIMVSNNVASIRVNGSWIQVWPIL